MCDDRFVVSGPCMRSHVVSSDTQGASAYVSSAVPSELKITKDSSVDKICDIFQKIGLMRCAPAIKFYKVNGHQLLHVKEEDWVHMLVNQGILGFQARSFWSTLSPYLDFA